MAQSVRGNVVQGDGATPASGVIVVFEDSVGSIAARALSDERGGFVLRLPNGGTFAVRALRIGYEPTVLSGVVVASTGTTTLRIQLSSKSVALPSVTVRGRDICRGQRSEGEVVAQVWEEARKALLASGLSANSAPLFAEWIEYERTLDPTARFVRAQRVKSTRSATTHAFKSAPAAVLAESGYVVDTDDGSVFHAPDAEVLLSDSFAAAHCFHVEPPNKEHADQIGVGFRPATERRRISDIEGTFWIHRASGELRSLDYRYTNLPSVAEQVRPGGVVEFLRLASGSWLVNRWSIRMPQLINTAPNTMRRRGVTVTGATRTVQAVRIVGGEVSRVERSDTVLFRVPGAALTVQLQVEDSVLSGADTRLSLDGTDYEQIANAQGRAELSPVLPGAYRLRALTPLMDSLGVAPEAIDVTVREGDTRVTMVPLPRLATLLKSVCGDKVNVDEDGHVRGVVVDSMGLPIANATVRLRWQQQIAIVRDRLMWNEQSIATTTDSLGLWSVCGVPRETGIRVRVESSSGQGRTVMRVPDERPFASAPVVVRPVLLRADGAEIVTASVTFSVRDSAGRAIRDADIVVTTEAGVTHRLRSDTSGIASLRGLATGDLTAEIRKVGFASGTLVADIDVGENTMPIVLSRSSVPTLAAMRVVGDRPENARHNEFERRRQQGLTTTSITADEIAKRNPVSVWQMFTRVPSLSILDSAGYIYARSTRTSKYLCWPRLAIDGNIVPGRPNLADLPAPSTIYGIEIFAGPARLPTELGGSGEYRFCGLISIWTK